MPGLESHGPPSDSVKRGRGVRPAVRRIGKQVVGNVRVAANDLIASPHEADSQGEGKGFEVSRPRAFASSEGCGSVHGVTSNRCVVAGTRSKGTPD